MKGARELACDALISIEQGAMSHIVIRETLDGAESLDARDKRLFTNLVRGSLERQLYLDAVIDGSSSHPVKKQKPFIRALLRMSVYQIIFLDSIPDSAAVNEAVKLAGRRGFRGLSGFVNGVLRAVARKKDYQPESLSVKYSVPEWLLSLWEKDYGTQKTLEMLEGFYGPGRLWARFNKSLAPEADIIGLLSADCVSATVSGACPDAYMLSGCGSVESLSAFKKGLIQIQDVSSIRAL